MSKLYEVVQRPEQASQRQGHVLYTPAKPVLKFDADLESTVTKMIETMHHEDGIGIAAPQVDIPLQIFIIESNMDSARYSLLKKYPQLQPVPQQVFINPRIVEASKESIAYWHGCLSAKGLDRGRLRSYKSLRYEAQDVKGKKVEGSLDNLAAIIFQHEFRHLLGGLYVDHAKEFLKLEDMREAVLLGKTDLYTEKNIDEIPHILSDYQIGAWVGSLAK